MELASDPVVARHSPRWRKEWPQRSVALFPHDVVLVAFHGALREGPDTLDAAEHLGQALSDCLQRVRLFADMGALTHYDSQVRTANVDAIRPRYDRVEEIIVYAESPLAKMGVTVARMALPKVKLLDRAEFLAKLEQRLKGV